MCIRKHFRMFNPDASAANRCRARSRMLTGLTSVELLTSTMSQASFSTGTRMSARAKALFGPEGGFVQRDALLHRLARSGHQVREIPGIAFDFHPLGKKRLGQRADLVALVEDRLGGRVDRGNFRLVVVDRSRTACGIEGPRGISILKSVSRIAVSAGGAPLPAGS